MASWRRSAGASKGAGKLSKQPVGEKMSSGYQEEMLAVPKSNKADRLFDTVIGHIEDIMIDDRFQQLQQSFLDKHYMTFDDSEENKLIYTDIHNEYVDVIEQFLETELNQRMPSFNMTEFQKQLVARRKHLEGEVFDMLLTFTDFIAFKELILDHKASKEGSGCSFGDDFFVCNSLSIPAPVGSGGFDVSPTFHQSAVSEADEPEPMRISLDLAKSDNEDNMTVHEELSSNLDSLVIGSDAHSVTPTS